MKKYLLLLLLSALSGTAFGQTNPTRDEKAQAEKDRMFYSSHKIKEVDMYLFASGNEILSDSALFCKLFYDKKGELVKLTQYTNVAGTPNKISSIDISTYEYDSGKLTQKVTTKENYMNIHGNQVKGSGIFDNTTNYEYDKKGNLLAEDYHSNMMLNNQPIGYKAVYRADDAGNTMFRKIITIKGETSGVYRYTYDTENKLVGVTYFRGDSETPESHPKQYRYFKTDSGFVKLENVNNDRDSVTKQNEYIYDKNGNQTAGYEIVNGNKRQVLNFKYNDAGKAIESRGGPVNMKEVIYKDVRRDGLAHLFYEYDADGLLTKIKKYELDKLTRKEILTAVELLVYKK